MSAAPPLNPIGTIAQNPIDSSGASWLGSAWWQQLQPGSWRGVPFVMDTTPTKAGRRIAVHEYPYRDTVWPEDLGKLPRRYQVSAFLVGDDCYQQKRKMIAACEQAGAGTLVHPILGSLQCVLIDFSTADRRDRGRYVEVEFEFIDAAANTLAPAASAATGNLVQSQAANLNSVSATALASNFAGVPAIPTASTAFVSSFASLAVNAVNDPARALSAVAGLQGLFGRYATGRLMTLQPSTATVASVLAQTVTTRQAVLDAATALTAAAAGL
jgi:prophage DNA circulation protein